MPIDINGYCSLSLREIEEAVGDVVTMDPSLLYGPVWVKGQRLYHPVRNVLLMPGRKLILEIHHG